MKNFKLGLLACMSLLLMSQAPLAAQWSNTQVDLQLGGKLITPDFGLTAFDPDRAESKNRTTILTFQHASGWSKGGNFFFIDFSNSDKGNDWYGEWYSTLSYSKLTGKKFSGILRDIGFTMGLNMAADANVVKYIPGIRFDLNVPGFAFVNVLVGAYIDGSEGLSALDSRNTGGTTIRIDRAAPTQSDSWIVDVSWKKVWGDGKWSFAGHAEYIASRKNTYDNATFLRGTAGEKVSHHILFQPQVRYHFTKQLAAGIEYQYWVNKLGDRTADESTPQLLITYTF